MIESKNIFVVQPTDLPTRAPTLVVGMVVILSTIKRPAVRRRLERNVKRATLVRADGIDASYKQFIGKGLDALAGLKPRLLSDRERSPGSRILDGRFTAVQQATGTPRKNSVGAAFLQDFVEHAKASGLVARLIERHKVRGLSVAPSG